MADEIEAKYIDKKTIGIDTNGIGSIEDSLDANEIDANEIDANEIDANEIDTNEEYKGEDDIQSVIDRQSSSNRQSSNGKQKSSKKQSIIKEVDVAESDIADDKFIRNIIDTLFDDNPNLFVSHHLDSYNDFFNNGIKRIIKEKNPIRIIKHQEDDKELQCHLYIGGKSGDKLHYGKPVIFDEQAEHFMYPNDARLRNMTYGITIHYDVDVEYFINDVNEKQEEDKKSSFTNPQATKTFEKNFLGRFPIMLMSDQCILKGLTPAVRFELGECKNDYGGYFIIDGKEKCIVSQEKFADNMMYIKDKVDDEFSHSADIRSVSEDASKPVRTLSVRIVSPSSKFTNKQIVVNVPNVRKPVPLFILMRALGIESDKDIIKHCLLDLNKYESYIDLFIPCVHDSCRIFTQDLAIEFIAKLTKGKTVAHSLEILTNYLLPHIGEMNFKDKAFYIGHMVKELLKVYVGDAKATDRDNFRFKRVELPGSLIYDLFKEYYTMQQKSIFLKLDKKYHFNQPMFQNEKFFDLVDIFSDNPFVEHIVDAGFKKAFKGNWGAEAHTKRLGVVQDLNRLSYNSAISHLRKLNLPLDASAKVVGPRLLHSSQWGIIDPVDTPDGGNIGLHKHMSISASITSGMSSIPFIKWLINTIKIQTLAESNPDDFSFMTKVFVNGNWVGCINDPKNAELLLKTYRRNAIIPVFISINWEIKENIIFIYTDAGRLCRPVFYVEKGVPSYNRDAIFEKILDKKITWETLLTGFAKKKDDKFSMYNNTIYKDWSELYDARRLEDLDATKAVIEYMDTSEAESSLIAMDHRSMSLKPKPYTHLEIHPSLILGTMGNQIVFPENNPYPRNAFACGQMRQAISLYHTNHQTRIDKMGVVLNYGQVPLVKSRYIEKINREQNPYGENVIVAIMSFNGYNVEDSILFNEGAVKRGLFRMTYYNMYESREESSKVANSKINSHFLNIENSNVERLKVGYDYSELDEHGLIKENTKLDDKKVLIGRGILPENGGDTYIDSSVFPKKGQLGYVDKSFMTNEEKGFRLAKVKVRDERYPYIGDKFCSRCGQKGTVGLIIPEADMPFTAEGIRPDIIINPHAIPSRMTIGQLVETIMGKACSIYGGFGDCTAYANKGSKIKLFSDMLNRAGLHSSGNEIMYNGQTGESFATDIFIGPTYYMRLKHMVKDKINYRARGPRTNLTRQTVQGRANDGGLRIGEMERDGVVAHGASLFLQESLMVRGDEYYMAVCNQTGMIAIYNESRNLFLSPLADGPLKFTGKLDGTMKIENVSKYGRSFSVIRVPYAFKLLVQELQTINIQIRVITDENVDQLTSMGFSDNIVKLMDTDESNLSLKTKNILSSSEEISGEEYDSYKKKVFSNYSKDVSPFLIDDNTYHMVSDKLSDMANKISTAILLELEGDDDDYSIIRKMNIVDATANIGASSMAFFKYFGHVDMIESNSQIIQMLNHNINYFIRENNISPLRYHIYQGDYKDIVVNPNINKDIIFIDPLIYNNNKNIVMKDDKNKNIILMGDITIEQLVIDMLELFSFVVIKLPLNHTDLFKDDDRHRHIFIMKYSNTQILIYKSEKNVEKYLNKKQIDLNSRIKAEENGWYLLKDMTNGFVFGSIIKDDDGNETDRWSVEEHDGMYPNVPVIEWESSELVYDDGKPISASLMMKRLRQNFSDGNWKTQLNLIKKNIDYTPSSPSRSYEIQRLPDEHIPSDENNYIPTSPEGSTKTSPEGSTKESSYEKDYEIARTSPAVAAAAAAASSPNTLNNVNNALQTVSKQLNDVQSQVSTYTQSAKNLATDIVANVSSNTSNIASKASEAVNKTSEAVNNTSEVVANKASEVANNASVTAANVASQAASKASQVGNVFMNIVEGDKPISSILTAITEEAPVVNKEEDKKKDEVKSVNIKI